MENDLIRASGTNTLVDIWIEGKMRSLCVSQQAIGAHLGFNEAKGLSDRDRCEFVRANLALIVTAAQGRLREFRRRRPTMSSSTSANCRGPTARRATAARPSVERLIGERPNVLAPGQSRASARRSSQGATQNSDNQAGLTGLGSLAVLALFRLSQHVIGRLDLLESPGGFRVARIGVGMGFLDEPAMAALTALKSASLRLQRIERAHFITGAGAIAGPAHFHCADWRKPASALSSASRRAASSGLSPAK